MAEFMINDQDLVAMKGKVVIVTGGSSGIGLATVEMLLSLGATVISGDIQPPPHPNNKQNGVIAGSSSKQQHGDGDDARPSPAFTFVKTNVAVWDDLVALFKKAEDVSPHDANNGHRGGRRIDHVFANAGIGPCANYLELDVDDRGDPREPAYDTLDVGLRGVMNTAALAVHYMRRQQQQHQQQQRAGGTCQGGSSSSIVLTGSVVGLQRLRAVDYATTKHGVLGFGRGLSTLVQTAGLPIRINTLMPTWTDSNVVPNLRQKMDRIGVELQATSSVARAAILMMADPARHGHVIYVGRGRYKEIDESILLPAYESIKGDYPWEDDVFRRLVEIAAQESN